MLDVDKMSSLKQVLLPKITVFPSWNYCLDRNFQL